MRTFFILGLCGAVLAAQAAQPAKNDGSTLTPRETAPTEVRPAGPTAPAAPTAPGASNPAPAPPPLGTTRPAPPAPPAVDPRNPRAWLWEYRLKGFTEADYRAAVEGVFADYERRLGRSLGPGEKRRAGLKVATNTVGLSTSLPLLRAVIGALEARGFKPGEIFVLDQSYERLRSAGLIPRTGEQKDVFGDVPLLILDRGKYFDPKWNYESPLPAPDAHNQRQIRAVNDWKFPVDDRRSYLPVPLLLEVDFWINLPVGIEDPQLGFTGALANASVLNVSNAARFLSSPQSGAAAVAEISAVPELSRGLALSLLSLERFQYIGGPLFNSLYCETEPTLIASANPVIVDTLLFQRINRARNLHRLPPIDQPAFLEFAQQLGLGETAPNRIYLVRLPN